MGSALDPEAITSRSARETPREARGVDGLHCGMALGTKQKQLTGVLLAVAFCCVQLVHGKSSLSKLQIGIKHRPAACSRRAQPGDEVSIHYTVRGPAIVLMVS